MNSLWISSINEDMFSKYISNSDSDVSSLSCDVCIVGAGIFGLTCAYYLSKLGFKVIVLEKYKIGQKTTGHTTAKITSSHGLFYDYLIHNYGTKCAKDYLNANEDAIYNIKNIVDCENIKCDFEFQNNYVYTTKIDDLQKIKNEVSALDSLGYNCDFVTETGLPFEIKGAVCFKKQAQFHPLKYLSGLCKSIIHNNGKIFTNNTVFDVKKDGDSYVTFSSKFNVNSKYVIIATHYPFINVPGFYFTKMYQSTSYIIAVDPKKSLFNGMYINAGSPTFSFRSAKIDGKELLLIGGGDHKTGHPSSYRDTYGVLEDMAKKFYPDSEVLYRWDTRDCISLDKIPYIGTYSNFMPNVFVGTGFKKWGMTSSNVAANIIVDEICGKKNKYAYLFDSNRLKPIKNADEMKNMIVQSSNSLFFDKFKSANMNFDDIANDSGSIIEVNNEKVGIYKDSSGNIFAVKPVCTHLRMLAFLE